jgi:hypothetical protein
VISLVILASKASCSREREQTRIRNRSVERPVHQVQFVCPVLDWPVGLRLNRTLRSLGEMGRLPLTRNHKRVAALNRTPRFSINRDRFFFEHGCHVVAES